MTEDLQLATTSLDTPIGTLRLAASEDGLTHVLFPNDNQALKGGTHPPQAARDHLEKAREALRAYFAGERSTFDDIVLAPKGTPFQKKVWAALKTIPLGQTRSYQDIAVAVDNPKAMRAVGLANGRNPIPIIVPCHRVIGADGSLTGFGGGLPAKRWLLEFEGAARPSARQRTMAF